MTNEEIIIKAAIRSGLFTEQQVSGILSQSGRLPLHTYSEWKRLGYQVKEGEHASLTVSLWRFCKDAPSKDTEAQELQAIGERAYTTKSHLFTASQVEKTTSRTVRTKEELAAYNRMLAEQRRARKAS